MAETDRSIFNFSPYRLLFAADLHNMPASGYERAPGYVRESAGNNTRDGGKVLSPAAGVRQCGQQPLGVRVFRSVKDIADCALLHDFSGIKYRHTITRFSDHAHVMSD